MIVNKNFIFSIFITIFFISVCISYYIYKEKQYTVDVFIHKASHHFKNEEYFQAIRYYKKLILMGVTDEKIYINTTISLIRTGNYKKAINYLLNMEKESLPSSEMYYLLAYSYCLQFKIDNNTNFKIPIKYLEKSIVLDSRNKESYNLLGTIYEQEKNFEVARKWYKKALSEDIDNASEFYGLIANTYFKEKNYDTALKYYETAIKNNKNYLSAYCSIAEIYTLKGQNDTAKKFYERAIEIDPDYTYPYYKIGNLFFLQDDYKQALEWYKKVLEIEPNDAVVNYCIGITYKKMNMTEEAEKHLKSAAYCGNDDALKELNLLKG